MKDFAPTRSMILRSIFAAEIRQFTVSSRALHIIPLLAAGALAVAWRFPPPPLLAAVAIGLAALEPGFNSILFRTPREFEAMSLLPVPQRNIVLGKNLATILLSLVATILSASLLVFFADRPVGPADVRNASLLFLSLVFPLLHSGNRRSLQHPRRITGWQTDDLIEGFGFLVTMALFSLPYLVLIMWLDRPFLCLLYCAATAAYWLRSSIPSTARRIEQERLTVCSTR